MFWVTEAEYAMIQKKMELAGIGNMSAYLRKIAIDGYVARLDIPELRDLMTNLHRSGANLNQLIRRVSETGRIYDTDLEDIHQSYVRLQATADGILEKLAVLHTPSTALMFAREPQSEALAQDNQ